MNKKKQWRMLSGLLIAMLVAINFNVSFYAKAVVGPTLTIGSQTASNGDSISVPLTGDYFSDVGSMTFSVNYNNLHLTYTGYTSVNINSEDTIVNNLDSKVNVVWENSNNPLNLDGVVIMTINFNVISGESIQSDITFSNTEIGNSSGDVLPSTFIGGAITLNSVDIAAPTVPELLSPLDGDEFNYDPILSWTESTDTLSGVKNYDVEISSDDSSEDSLCDVTVTATSEDADDCMNGSLDDGTYYWRVRARDNAGNVSDWSAWRNFIKDTVMPQITLETPVTESYHKAPINISGSATDNPLETVKYIHLYYEGDDDEGWTEIDTDPETAGIQPLLNSEDAEPFPYSYLWTPSADGTYRVGVRAEDKAGNWSDSDTEDEPILWKYDVIYDTTAPSKPLAEPVGGDFYNNITVTLSASDGLSGLKNIYYTTDGSEPTNESTVYVGGEGGGIALNKSTTIKAIAYDNAGNASEIMNEYYAIAPLISEEGAVAVEIDQTSATIIWTTDDPSTSRVIYDTASHPELGAAPNYGYANSTSENSAKVTSHSVVVSGLTAGTTYYVRAISAGSPETVSNQISFSTSAASGGGGGTFTPSPCASVDYEDWQTTCVNNLQFRNIKALNPTGCQMTQAQRDAAKQNCSQVLGEQTFPPIEGGGQVLGAKACEAGSLLKGPDGKIYLIKDGAKYWIRTLKELATYKNKKTCLVDVDTLSQYPDWTAPQQVLGVKVWPNGSLLRGTDKKVWLITKGQRFHIISLKELWKYRSRKINNVSNETIAQYPILPKL